MASIGDIVKPFRRAGMAVDPVHVGTGGARLGRVDNTIVRDPVTHVPKIPGSSLAGVLRAYAAMMHDRYPGCAGQGQAHCRRSDCLVCTVFGFAAGDGGAGGFAGLAAFSDAHVLLFPVATREGPMWVTCPLALQLLGGDRVDISEGKACRAQGGDSINLGWLLLPTEKNEGRIQAIKDRLSGLNIPDYIQDRLVMVSDKLFAHVINSNLEVRTSVSIDPATGAAQKGALFTYEALPRGTVLYWDVTCRNPKHFRINNKEIGAVTSADAVHDVVSTGYRLMEHLGIGGMGTRGMGRLRVFNGAS